MKEFFLNHQVMATYITVAIINSAITAMPTPTDKSSSWYQWFFGMTHGAVLNIARVIAGVRSSSNGVNK